MVVLVSFIIIPLKATDDKKYQAQRYSAFSCWHTCSGSAACSAVQVSWKKSPGITFSGTGERATVYENRVGSTK